MSKIDYTPLSFKDFCAFLRHFKPVASAEDELLYKVYNEAILLLKLHHEAFSDLPYQPLEHARLILYLLYDYEYRLRGFSIEERIMKLDDEILFTKLTTVAVDKYGSESYFKFEENRLVNHFSMEISTLNVYVNFISLKLPQLQEPNETKRLYLDLLRDAFSIIRTVSELLVAGFEKEALSTWRSLHEVEATLILVQDDNLLTHYGRHIIYNAAFNKLLPQAQCDELFVEIKAKMKSFGLKSKDTRRFIEYGWISTHKDFDLTNYKFNFRDGVQKLANLGYAREAYQSASEAAHSSPLLLFMNPQSFLTMTLTHLYKSFLNIEALFAAKYHESAPQTEVNFYEEVRNLYLEDVHLVLNRITQK